MKKLLIVSAAVAGASLLPGWGAAHAQDSKDLRVRIGLGGQGRPQYIGADNYQLAPLFDFDIARGTNEFAFEAPDYGLSIPIISKDGFSFGPAANFASSRKNADVGAPVGKVASTIEAGGFADLALTRSIYLHAELLKGIGGHNGLVGTVGADQVWRDGDRYVFSVGPRVLFSDSRYQRAYFGVDSVAAFATGLPTYRPSGGVHAVALASGLSYQFNPRFGMFGFARYERLVGDAAKSPIVREFGSRTQLSGGLGLSYTFIVKR